MDKYAIYRLRFKNNRTYYELTDNKDFERYIREVVMNGYHDNRHVNALYADGKYMDVEIVADNIEFALARHIFNTVVTVAAQKEHIINSDAEIDDCACSCKLSLRTIDGTERSITKQSGVNQSTFLPSFTPSKQHNSKDTAKYIVDKVYFESTKAIEIATGLHIWQVRERLKSDKYPTWQKLSFDQAKISDIKKQRRSQAKCAALKQKQINAIKERKQRATAKWNIDGKDYFAFKAILADYNISSTAAYHRLKSPHWPSWKRLD